MVVYLGYLAEHEDDSELTRVKVPSKVGGRPSWVVARNLPSAESLTCKSCKNAMIFLCQLYAPRANAFYRMLYLFGCWSCGESVKVFRVQLAAENEWLPCDPAGDDEPIISSSAADEEILKQCCAHCIIPSKDAEMHLRCRNAEKNLGKSSVLAESLLGIEEEQEGFTNCDGITEAELVEKSRNAPIITEVIEGEENEDEEEEENGGRDDVLEHYINYMESHAPHVVRYGGDTPIWFSSKGQVDADSIPACERCGSSRKFEFQIQSSILDALDVGANLELAFGIIAVYSCPQNCEAALETYVSEFAFKQKDQTLNEKNIDQF